jgi:hypothetical protein
MGTYFFFLGSIGGLLDAEPGLHLLDVQIRLGDPLFLFGGYD